MQRDQRKIISRWHMLPEQSSKLKTFLDDNFAKIKADEEGIYTKLYEVIQSTFPEQSLDDLKRVLKGESGIAYYIDGLPERPKAELDVDQDKLDGSNTYAFHMGLAIYKHNQVAPHIRADNGAIQFAYHPRQSHLETDEHKPFGLHLHRDFKAAENSGAGNASSYVVMLACPINDEGAKTVLTDLKSALEAIPENVRKNTYAHATMHGEDEDELLYSLYTLDDVLEDLREGHQSIADELAVFAIPPADTIFGREPDGLGQDTVQQSDASNVDAVNKGINTHTDEQEVKRGGLFFWNERHIYHRGENGDLEKIQTIPKDQKWSRILLHLPGSVQSAPSI